MSDVKKVEFKRIQDKEPKIRPATRIDVTLTEPTEDSSSVFTWPSLIRKKHKSKREHKYKTLNGSFKNQNGDINSDGDDEEDVKQLARHFEQKYGGCPSSRKKKPMFFNYSDFAVGYDESDSFIDNSEAFDEEMPDELETYHGGYYVNYGPLEFKKVISTKKDSETETDSDVEQDENDVDEDEDITNDNENDEEGQGDEGEDQEEEEEIVRKKRSFAVIEDSDEDIENNASDRNNDNDEDDDDDEEDDSDDNAANEEDVNDSSSGNDDTEEIRLKEENEQAEEEDNSVKITEELESNKDLAESFNNNDVGYGMQSSTTFLINGDSTKQKKSKKRHSTDDYTEPIVTKHKKKSSIRVKPLVELMEENKSNDTYESMPTMNTEGADGLRESMKISIKRSAAHKNSNTKHIKLPDNLPSDVLEVVEEIKVAASRHNVADMGSRSFFNAYINGRLLSLETKIRSYSTRTRHKLYHHLSLTVPCSKETLMKRSKKLVIDEEEKRMTEPFKKLKMGIEALMPQLIEKYTADYQQASADSNLQLYLEMHDDYWFSNDDKKLQTSKIPQKKFPLNDEMKGHIRDLVICRLRCFYILKPRGESPEGYISKFLSTKLKPLWPQGWMRTSTLLKESHINNLLSKIKKGGSLTTGTGASSSSSSNSSSSSSSSCSSSSGINRRDKSTVPDKSSTVPAVNISPKHTAAKSHRNSSSEFSPSSQLNVNIPPPSSAFVSSLVSPSISSQYSSSNREQQQQQHGSGGGITTPVNPSSHKHDLNITAKTTSPLFTSISPAAGIPTSSMDLLSRIVSATSPHFGFDHNQTYSTLANSSRDQHTTIVSSSLSTGGASNRRHSAASSPVYAAAHIAAAAAHTPSNKRQSVSPIQAAAATTSGTANLSGNQLISPIAHHSQPTFAPVVNAHSSVSSSSTNSNSSVSSNISSRRQSVSPISSTMSPPKPSISPIYSNHPTLPPMRLQQQSSRDSISPKGGNNDQFKIDNLMITTGSCKTKPKDSPPPIHNMYHHQQHSSTTPSTLPPKYKKQQSSPSAAGTTNISNGNNVSTNRADCEQVLDLSSSKQFKIELSNNIIASSDRSNISSSDKSVIDHNYSGMKKEENGQLLEVKSEKSFVVPKESTSSKSHLSRKQRLLQETLASAVSQSSRDIQDSAAFSSSTVKMDGNEKRAVDETATATDILSLIINDTLQDNTTPLQPQFTNCFNLENRRHSTNEKKTDKYEQKLADDRFNKKAKCKKDKNNKKTADTVATGRSSSYDSGATAGRSTTCRDDSNNNPMNDAAEVMKDLMALNQFGRSTKMTIANFMDSLPVSAKSSSSPNSYDSKYKYPTGNTTGCTTSMNLPDINRMSNINAGSFSHQSSRRVSNPDCNPPGSIPRMDISGFQNEFFKHIDIFANQTKKHQHEHAYNKKERHQQPESSKAIRSTHHHQSDNIPSIPSMSENTILYPHQQSVIRPPINKPPPWSTKDSNM